MIAAVMAPWLPIGPRRRLGLRRGIVVVGLAALCCTASSLMALAMMAADETCSTCSGTDNAVHRMRQAFSGVRSAVTRGSSHWQPSSGVGTLRGARGGGDSAGVSPELRCLSGDDPPHTAAWLERTHTPTGVAVTLHMSCAAGYVPYYHTVGSCVEGGPPHPRVYMQHCRTCSDYCRTPWVQFDGATPVVFMSGGSADVVVASCRAEWPLLLLPSHGDTAVLPVLTTRAPPPAPTRHVQDSSPTTGTLARGWDVLHLNVDGLSVSQAKAHLPLTMSYLAAQPDGLVVPFSRYHAVGHHTLPNVGALLAGTTHPAAAGNGSRGSGRNEPGVFVRGYGGALDNIGWLWDDLRSLGYRTFVGEAECVTPFTFRNQPLPHYQRKATCYLDYQFGYDPQAESGGRCLGTTAAHQFLMEDIKNAWGPGATNSNTGDTETPKWGWWNFMDAHAASSARVRVLDADLVELLQWVRSRHPRTVVMLHSDHGRGFDNKPASLANSRSNMPLLTIVFPPSFPAEIRAACRQNSNRIVSAFDIRATVFELAMSQDPRPSRFGLSLLGPLPERGCAAAGVRAELCADLAWVNMLHEGDDHHEDSKAWIAAWLAVVAADIDAASASERWFSKGECRAVMLDKSRLTQLEVLSSASSANAAQDGSSAGDRASSVWTQAQVVRLTVVVQGDIQFQAAYRLVPGDSRAAVAARAHAMADDDGGQDGEAGSGGGTVVHEPPSPTVLAGSPAVVDTCVGSGLEGLCWAPTYLGRQTPNAVRSLCVPDSSSVPRGFCLCTGTSLLKLVQ